MSIIVKILWNLLCQYNNINISLHQYLKEKKKHKPITLKKKKEEGRLTKPKHCYILAATMHYSGIVTFYIYKKYCEICCVSITIYMPVYINI